MTFVFLLSLFVVVVAVDSRFAHLYDNGNVSFVHNSNVSLTMRDSSLHIVSLSGQPLYLSPSSCRVRNSTTTTVTTICGVGRLLTQDNANLLDKVSSESYELLIRQQERYLLKGHKSNYTLLVAFDDNGEGCCSYVIDNHDCRHQSLLRQLCENLPPRLIDAEIEQQPDITEDQPRNNGELRTLFNISMLMIAIDCITFVLYISLIVFMIKLLRNAYEPRCRLQQQQPLPPHPTARRFYFVRASSETAV